MQIDKKKLKAVIGTALGQVNKTNKLLNSIVLRIDKKKVIYGKLELETIGSFGTFPLSSLGAKITKTGDLFISSAFYDSLQYLRDKEIIVESNNESVLAKCATKNEKFLLPMDIEDEFNELFFTKLKFITKDEKVYAFLEKSLESDKYNEDDDEYAPVLSTFTCDTEELASIPDCDSLKFSGNKDGVFIESIEFGGTLGKYDRTLKLKTFEVKEEFDVRMDKKNFDIALARLGKSVNIGITTKYMSFIRDDKDKPHGYILGIIEEGAESMSESLVETIDGLDSVIEIEDLDDVLNDVEEEE